MADLEALLRQNYKGSPSPECRAGVIEYIRATESILQESSGFIRLLTVVADNILKFYPDYLDGCLGRLYRFNMEGVEKFDRELAGRGINDFVRHGLLTNKYYQALRAGAVSKAAFVKSRNGDWAVKWYDACVLAAEAAGASPFQKPDRSAHANGLAGDAAQALAYLARFTPDEVKWIGAAIAHYGLTLDYYAAHPNPRVKSLENVMLRIRKDRDRLRMLLVQRSTPALTSIGRV